MTDLIWLISDQSTPDRIAFRPDIFTLIIEPIAVLVDDDGKRNAVEAGDNTAVEFRRTAVNRNRMTLGWVTDRFNFFVVRPLDWNRAKAEELGQRPGYRTCAEERNT